MTKGTKIGYVLGTLLLLANFTLAVLLLTGHRSAGTALAWSVAVINGYGLVSAAVKTAWKAKPEVKP